MEFITKEEFGKLANYQADNCISIYMPTHSSGLAVNEKQDALVFKNNVQKAKNQLLEQGVDLKEAEVILAPAYEMIRNEGFWNDQSEGLAVFMAKGFTRIIKLPVSVKEDLLVNSTFLLSQLLPVMEKRHRFYLLVLSKHDCKFYEADQFGMKKLEVEGLPYDMDDVVHFEQKDQRQLHRRAGAAAGAAASTGASFHGHGTGLADDEEYLIQYLKEIDQTLWTEVLHSQNVPLMIAAVDYETAYYRQISNYKYIADVSLSGNYEHEDRHNLYLKAKEKLGPYFKEYCNQALKNYYDNSATELSSSIPAEVIPAACYAQVSDLFVEKNQHIWGRFNEQENELIIHEQKEQNDECLINKAIVKTILNGGEVHLLDKEKMPAKDTPVAAFLRFSL